jgi:rhomboid protease GluP
MVEGSPATSFILALNVLFFFGTVVTGGSTTQNLVDWGAKYGPYIAEGEIWRLFLPVLLHAGVFHLLANTFGLLIFGSMVEKIYRTRNFVAVYVAAGVMGNVVSFLAGPNPGVGASGAVFGIVGAFAVYLLLNRRMLGQLGSQQLTSVGVIVFINIVFGLASPGIDNAAHFGGLLAGALMAYFIAPRQKLVQLESPFSFGPPQVMMQPANVGTSRLVVALVIIGLIAVAITWYESQTYVTNIFGNKIPG